MPERESHPKRAGDRLDVALTTAASICIAAAVALAIWALYPNELDVRTDIVGYPIAHDFNVREYIAGYLLTVVAFPAVAIGTYALIRRLSPGRRQGLVPTPEPPVDPDVEAPEGGRVPSALARTAFVGAVWALVAALAFDVGEDWWLTVLLPVVLGYLAAIYLLSPQRDGSRVEGMATLNTIAAAFLGLGLVAISAGIEVTELDTGNVVEFPIGPEWLLALLAAAVGVAVTAIACRERDRRTRVIETRAILFLAAPIALWILLAENPGALPEFHLFEAGQRSLGSSLIGEGWVPWRDVILVHGPLEDGFFGLLGQELFQDSYWGDAAGRWIIVGPLSWIANFLLCAYLFRRNLLFLAITQLIVVLGWVDEVGAQRLILLPLVLLALAAVLERATWPRAAALMSVSIAQLVLVQEAALMSASAWGIVLVRDFAAWRGWAPYDEPWVRTVRCLVTGVIAAVIAAVVLAALGALDEFIEFFFTYSRDYELVAGIPFQWDAYDFGFDFWFAATPAVVLIAWWYAAARIGSGRWFTTRELVVGAAVIAALPYYLKFLARADGHVFNIAAVSIFPLMYIVYRLVSAGEDALRKSGLALQWPVHPITAALLVAALVAAPWSPTDVLREAPTRLAAEAPAAPPLARLGYSTDDEAIRLLPKIERAIDRHAGPEGTIFDLTNSPGLFYFLPDRKPGTRYQEMSTNVRESTQEDVVEELAAARPELVAYSSLSHGLATWDDIANPVRNYLVSDWLLDNYHPVDQVEDYVLMTPGVTSAPDRRERDLYFEAQTCDWSASPNFLDQHPNDEAASVPLDVSPAVPAFLLRLFGWAGEVEAGEPASEVLVVAGDEVLTSTPVDVPRSDVAAAHGNANLTDVGFDLTDTVTRGSASGPLRIFAVSGDAEASELGDSPGPPPSTLTREDGSTVPVVPGAVSGSVDQLVIERLGRYRLELPEDFGSYDWIRLSTSDGSETEVTLTDGGSEGRRAIGFELLDGTRTVDVRVGACPQWHGYRGRSLYLDTQPSAGRIEATLIR